MPRASAKLPPPADTFTGLTVGHAVIIKSGVVVTGILGLVDRDGYIVNSNSGVVVLVPVTVILLVNVLLLVTVVVGISDADNVPVAVLLLVTVVVGISDADNVPDKDAGTVGVTESESVMETVGSLLDVTDTVLVWLPVAVTDRVIDSDAGIDGVKVLLTDAASNPTLISIPQAWGNVSVAE
jgi:hypothetical protein